MDLNAQKVQGITTRNGKPVWVNDADVEQYSEKTSTFEYGPGYLVTPTIDPETGGNYKLDDLFAHYEENGPYDMFTGEKLPVFDDEATATEYSIWRSDNILNENITDQEFYTGESGAYYKQDGSDTSTLDYIDDARDHTVEIGKEVLGFFSEDSPESEDDRFARNTYNLGGLATSQKGITTQEGLDMAKNKFQLDRKKADKDGDGVMSKFEEVSAEAVQKAEADDELIEMSHGGMACGCEGDCDGSCGGIMSDPVSGNPIPVGSNPEEVRDDIDIKISQGEYVIPANVVRWHGLKHIMDMQTEAEMGLMAMSMDGLIQNAEPIDPEEDIEAEDPDYDISEDDIEIEVASVEVDDMTDEEEETEEVYPKESVIPGMKRKQKYAFIT